MHYYIGIDVSKQSLAVFDGTKEYDVPNERGLKTLKKLLKKNYGKEWNEVKLIYESTGPYSNYLREFASKNRIKVYVVNPKKSANFAKTLGNRSKTDAIDARMLYRFNVLLNEEDLKIPSVDNITEQLWSYISSYKIIQKTRTMLSNHMHSKQYEIVIKDKNAIGVNSSMDLNKSLKKETEKLKRMEEAIKKQMGTFCKTNPEIKEDFDNLLSIKGVGVISATALLHLFKKYPDTNRNEITALAGLDPVRRQSGSSLNGGRKISKAGDSFLRKSLYSACMSAIQYNVRIEIFYNRLIDNHKKGNVALTACMKKLLLIAHQVYINKTKYKPLYTKDKKSKDTKIKRNKNIKDIKGKNIKKKKDKDIKREKNIKNDKNLCYTY